MKQLFKNHPIIVAAAALIIGMAGISLPINGVPPSVGSVCVRIVLFFIMAGVMALIGVEKPLPGMKGFGATMIRSWYVLLIMFALGMLIAASPYADKSDPVFLIKTELAVLAFSLSVGLFEESLFRGVIFNALMKKTGTSYKGLVAAALLSSLIFGFVHVYEYVFGGSYDINGIIESVLKTLQTGALGFFLAALYIRYDNIWALALIHGLNDFFPLQGVYLTRQTERVGTYASGGEGVSTSAIIYFVTLIIFIPIIIYSFRLLKQAAEK